MQDYSLITGSRCCIIDNDILWTVSYNTDALLKINLSNKQLINAYMIPGYNEKHYGNVSIVMGLGKVFIFPHNSVDIKVFDIDNETFELICFGSATEVPLIHISVIDCNEEKIYFWGLKDSGGYCLDIKTKRITEKSSYLNVLDEMGVDLINENVFYFYEIKDNTVFMPIRDHNILLIYHIKTDEYEYKRIGNDNIKLRTITFDNSIFVFTTSDDKIITWDGNHILSIDNLGILGEDGDRSYFDLIIHNKKLYLIPDGIYYIYLREEGNTKKIEYNYPRNNQISDVWGIKFMLCFYYDNKVFFQAYTNGQLFSIDLDTDVVSEFNIFINDTTKDLKGNVDQKKDRLH